MFFTNNNLDLYYGSTAIIIVILYMIGVKLPNYTWPVYGLVGLLFAIFTNS